MTLDDRQGHCQLGNVLYHFRMMLLLSRFLADFWKPTAVRQHREEAHVGAFPDAHWLAISTGREETRLQSLNDARDD